RNGAARRRLRQTAQDFLAAVVGEQRFPTEASVGRSRMRNRGDFLRHALAANECASPHVAADEPFGFELGIRVRDGGAVNASMRREFAACGDAFARTQIAPMNQRANLIAQLDVERNVTLGLEMEWNHWL